MTSLHLLLCILFGFPSVIHFRFLLFFHFLSSFFPSSTPSSLPSTVHSLGIGLFISPILPLHIIRSSFCYTFSFSLLYPLLPLSFPILFQFILILPCFFNSVFCFFIHILFCLILSFYFQSSALIFHFSSMIFSHVRLFSSPFCLLHFCSIQIAHVSEPSSSIKIDK